MTGCAFIHLQKEVEIIHESTILVGNVSTSIVPWQMPVVVAAYAKNKDIRKVAHYTILHEPGSYELMVPKGNCFIFAFGDTNGNLVYEAGEPAGQYIGPQPIFAPGGGVVSDLDFIISETSSANVDFPVGSAVSPKRPKKLHSTLPGALADLDDELFSDAYGIKGYWEPMDFFKEVGGNIYFLGEYDPKKIPILFVHGAAGSPQNWKYFFDNIDLSRYQPWFYYYPSGSSLQSMSHLLLWKLLNLRIKYNFDELYITAHSMGGLVVRSFLLDHGHYFPQVKLFISISTPWGGEKLAESGVKYSPAVIPAWKDMQPEGEFIKSLFHKTISPEIDYYLFFGHKGNRNPIRPNNDGAVTLTSQLDLRPQSEAKMIYGFNENHMSILSSREVLAQYNAILAARNEPNGDAPQFKGGKMQVHYSFDYPAENPRPRPSLLLSPVDKNRAEIILYHVGDTGQDFGPFPAGDYKVSMIASAFRAEPHTIPVTIAAGKIPTLKFSLIPQGNFLGYITMPLDKSDNPAGIFRAPAENVRIQSITLTGAGVNRTLIPLQGEVFNYSDHYLSGKDYAFKAWFCFFDLPEGPYELTIKAEGYEHSTTEHRVVPGQLNSSQVIELNPLKSP